MTNSERLLGSTTRSSDRRPVVAKCQICVAGFLIQKRGTGMSVLRRFWIGSLLLLLAAGNDARAQMASPPVLTIDDAVATAMKGNRRVQSSILDVSRAGEKTADVKTERLPHFQVYALGGEALRSIDFTIPRGVLGTYQGIGPIPGQNSKISTSRTFTGLVLGQATQPASQLWKVHLAILES